MQINLKTYKGPESKAHELEREISKSNLIKSILIGITIALTTIWLVFLIMSVIIMGNNQGNLVASNLSWEQVRQYLDNGATSYVKVGDDLYNVFRTTGDINPFYIGDNTIALLFLMFAPIGYIGIIVLIAMRFGVLKPASVRDINRKALSLGYLKQKDFDYINEAIDINIGLKALKEKEAKDEGTEE